MANVNKHSFRSTSHNPEIFNEFCRVASRLSEYELLQAIIERYCDDQDLKGVIETIKETCPYPIAEYVKEIKIPREGSCVTVFKDITSGGLFAIDSSFIDHLDGDEDIIVREPFNNKEVKLTWK